MHSTNKTNVIKQIGKGGAFTSFIVHKKQLKTILKGGNSWSNCQESMNDQIVNNKQWLDIIKVLQNIPGKGIATMIGNIKNSEVIVKIQMEKESHHEFNIQNELKNINGFIKYYCQFFCEGDKDYIEQYSTVKQGRLCKAIGNNMGIIIMPYYNNGCLEDQLKKGSINIINIRNVITKVIQSMFDAYEHCEFTHGDLFTKNVILDNDYNPIIIDFEKSSVHKSNTDRFWRDLDDFLGDIARYELKDRLEAICRILIMNRAYNIPPNNNNMSDLINAINNL